jgi:hypothetical protein
MSPIPDPGFPHPHLPAGKLALPGGKGKPDTDSTALITYISLPDYLLPALFPPVSLRCFCDFSHQINRPEQTRFAARLALRQFQQLEARQIPRIA